MLSLCIQWPHIWYPAIVLIPLICALLYFVNLPNKKRKTALGLRPNKSTNGALFFENNEKTIAVTEHVIQ